ncbi:uncharacterized protein LOC106177646 isoform X2 [Lingula anatina]|uniref:Uncharacterized protein LOC106177646 isoform X1 n=1 Tax=Lingula anatina TaxID=7574 RepID=A0A1S3K0X9_LINAN|nr:uncharacterized protein LOC106177646 isoform X1 [Lingula anatina]XP_013415937.1 uncharacterized protein LOC106177646 isoform X2 [Lingula anatina]|eukprot:XP_013415936.1 uncharacterized protein LOC106177646 isoform X1 [Lingula anatina]
MGACVSSQKDYEYPDVECNEKTSLVTYTYRSGIGDGQKGNLRKNLTVNWDFVPKDRSNKHKQKNTAVKSMQKLKLKELKIQDVDREFRESAKVYNDIVDRRQALTNALNSLRPLMKHTNTEFSIPGVTREIQRQLVDVKLKVDIDSGVITPTYGGVSVGMKQILFTVQNIYSHIRDLRAEIPFAVTFCQNVILDEGRLREVVIHANAGPLKVPRALQTLGANMKEFLKALSALSQLQVTLENMFDDIREGLLILGGGGSSGNRREIFMESTESGVMDME